MIMKRDRNKLNGIAAWGVATRIGACPRPPPPVPPPWEIRLATRRPPRLRAVAGRQPGILRHQNDPHEPPRPRSSGHRYTPWLPSGPPVTSAAQPGLRSLGR